MKRNRAATGSEPVSIAEIRNRLTDFTLVIFSVLGLPALLASLLRYREFGWIDTMGLHAGAYLLVLGLFLARRRFSYPVKAGFILGLLFIVGSGSFPSIGAAGSGVYFYLTTVVLATLFFGFSGGVTAFILCLAGLVAALLAAAAGYIQPEVDMNLYSLSSQAWSGKIAAFTLLGGLSLGLMALMQNWLTNSIREMAVEIEERRRTEMMLEDSLGEKEILLREIHHRVKSNLQAISALLEVHAVGLTDAGTLQVISDSQSRIRVMARIHEELYSSSDMTSIDFSSFLKKLISDIMYSMNPDPERIKWDLHLEPTALVMDTAIPCGLIVNELITNSLKYAFPGQRKGTIRVEFKQTGEDEYRLSVSDDGIGMPASEPVGERPGSLGVKLINSLSQQLGAESGFSLVNGTTFTLTFREYREAGAQDF